MEQVSIVRVLNYDIMYKKQSLAVWKKSKRQMIQTVILETLSIACRHMLLVIASKRFHASACHSICPLVFCWKTQDPLGISHCPKAHKLAKMKHIAGARRIPSNYFACGS